MTRPKNWHISSNISGSTAPIFASFTPHKSALSADGGSVAYFHYLHKNLLPDVYCILCENFVKFGPVTPELTGLICARQA